VGSVGCGVVWSVCVSSTEMKNWGRSKNGHKEGVKARLKNNNRPPSSSWALAGQQTKQPWPHP
jgi:hypothetical protein